MAVKNQLNVDYLAERNKEFRITLHYITLISI